MNKLSPRLQAVADFITVDNTKIIDIGCDHAFLSIYLANKYKDVKIIASDVNKNALESAKNNIGKANLSDRIDIRLGNGLDVVETNDINTVIISGMGANTIVGILKYAKDKLTNVNNIIIQSNTDLTFLRKNLMNIGYYIEDETLVEDKKIIYTVIKFTKGKRKYNYKELYLGPILIRKNDYLFKKKNEKELLVLETILKNIGKGHYLYKQKIKKNIKILSELD